MKKQVLPSINISMSEKNGDVSFPWYMFFKKISDSVFGTFKTVFHNDTLDGEGTEEKPLGVSKKTLDSKVDKAGDIMSGELTVPELTVAGEEGALNVSVIGNTPTIASNNGMDVLAATTFDKVTKTNDSTTWDRASSVDLVRKAQVATALTQKQDVSTALNYDNATNCITEIPQDIKLELNNGTLTIKAGSKIYYPNGSGVFNKVVLTTDKTYTDSTKTGQWFICLTQGLAGTVGSVANSVSGTSQPTVGFSLWYNTEENIMYRYGSITSDPASNVSLPIAIITLNNTGVASIDQVFNGFGYIGSTVFALPGVKGLVPNGRNGDGTLKNTLRTTTAVSVYTLDSVADDYVYQLAYNGTLVPFYSHMTYNAEKNINYNTSGTPSAWGIVGSVKFNNNVISEFNPKTTFHAVDYSDTEFIAHQAMPSYRYTDLSLPAHGTYMTMPADGYLVMSIESGVSGQGIGLRNHTAGDIGQVVYMGGTGRYIVHTHVSKGDSVQVYHYNSAPNIFRLVYGNGLK